MSDVDEVIAAAERRAAALARADAESPADLEGVEVVVTGDTAVLRADVVDVVVVADRPGTFRMPVTQVWVRADGGWRCLAGHAGPRREPAVDEPPAPSDSSDHADRHEP